MIYRWCEPVGSIELTCFEITNFIEFWPFSVHEFSRNQGFYRIEGSIAEQTNSWDILSITSGWKLVEAKLECTQLEVWGDKSRPF